ncbi:uncharacterized protein LACBIDRAFT_314983 [Laccaria bicolor S238N-H82]|uniref:Predicted protein n=1 Tax=Laccaria bicolor (strain S238N-H82 / ATCC MYA-4686) TaxID=486041 RepID=B0DZI4_LACBS|nr:uncharacterized protein LACBIDRAFT_314983 [Laccaria bicolor S238N-H82]EDQ99946.1 predicted protein [Laccaria bicolor S238N-H82]|eukprot:XP_001889357.1 predicted protein [Laccaria bicolor S238N-H82]
MTNTHILMTTGTGVGIFFFVLKIISILHGVRQLCRYIFISVVGQSPAGAHCKSSESARRQALPSKQSFINTATLSPRPNYLCTT